MRYHFNLAGAVSQPDVEGHDLFANYAVMKGLTVGVRAMRVERITNRENGSRARLDVVYSF